MDIKSPEQVATTANTAKWQNPVEGMVTSSYGDRTNPVLHKQEFHDGIDIAVIEGTEVKTPQDARVSAVGTSKTFGTYIKLKTDDGYEIMFAHLSKTKAKEGKKVAKGEVVALSGNTGLSTGAHVHYSLWLNGKQIDPMYYVKLPHTDEVKTEYKDRGEYIN